MFATSLISLAGWLTIYTSNSYEQILVGRAISGIATGMASVPTTVYVAEIASSKLRSTMVTWTSVFTAFAVFIVYIFGYIFKVNVHEFVFKSVASRSRISLLSRFLFRKIIINYSFKQV